MRMLALLFACCSMFACTAGEASGPTANVSVAGFMGGTVTATGTFTQSGTDVLLSVTLSGCVAGKTYNTHIHQGSDCTDTMTQGGHWDMTRGEGIPAIMCTGTTGTTFTTRSATPDVTAWSVGGNATTNVIGHVLVVHDPDMATTRIGCGLRN